MGHKDGAKQHGDDPCTRKMRRNPKRKKKRKS